MTDKLRNHHVNPIEKRAFWIKTALTTLLSASILSQPVNAAETQWWFDVEVILFERNLQGADISEKFAQSQLLPPDNQYIDLLTPYLQPDLRYLRAGLDYCRASNQQAVKLQYEQDFAFPASTLSEYEPEKSQQDPLAVSDISSTNQEEVLATNTSEENPDQGFQYQVATTDIFSQSDDHNTSTEPSKVNSETRLNSELGDNESLGQPTTFDSTAELNVTRAPINVEFIEWQIPKQLPCAYSEQIDPTFASMSYMQETHDVEQQTSMITKVPVVIDGIQWPQKRAASLLPKSTLRMDDLYQKIKKQRDIDPILHLSWRQQVHFGRENSQTIRLFAGHNYAQHFDTLGFPLPTAANDELNSSKQTEEFYIPQQELALLSPQQQQTLSANVEASQPIFTQDLFSEIDRALADDSPIDFSVSSEKHPLENNNLDSTLLSELWQLDGGITVYLRRVGRVPYLHIDSNLNYRQPVYDPNKALKPMELTANAADIGLVEDGSLDHANYLQSVNFNQLRRVISKQVHYFDHPLFGMIVRITRYRWPEIADESDLQNNE
ncbi:MAG: CsiV family protein [Paraglaciecola sp.]|uniref:CsiV family protein n=1 Tax=Paraglaciecola sp. TaxID=1920173 RepID=UPI003296D592